ncbi:MAG: hypothetical protein DMG82_03255 [Acidobacteria bacterium]|nr:MAG: hypothetical protein DMG82_03255 [Acidobacteriota bacterium]
MNFKVRLKQTSEFRVVPLFDCAKDLKDGFAVLLLAVAHRDLHRAVESCEVLHACNHRHAEKYADGSHM